MQPGKSPRRTAGILPFVALLLALASVPAPVSAAPAQPGDGDLSPRLAELAKPAVRSSSQAKQAEELGLAATGPGSLLRDGNRVLVEVRFDHGAAAGVDDLRATAAQVVDVSPRYQTVTVAAKPGELPRLSAVSRVKSASEVLTPLAASLGDPSPGTAAAAPACGAATSEGDEQLRASLAREEFEVDGTGIKVGVLSDSFNRDGEAATDASADVASGDLPGPGNPCGHEAAVDILDDSEAEGADEGRGMAQIIHDLAPGAELSFATAFSGLTSFADNIEALAAAGADAVVDDVAYFEEPFFQEGPVGVAISNVVAGGSNYFSSAGNNNLRPGGHDIASWEAEQFRDSSGCPSSLIAISDSFGGLNADHCMDFDPSSGVDRSFRIRVSPDATLLVDLQWAEAWDGVGTDIDAFLFDSEGAPLSVSIADNVFDKRPFEFLAWENPSESSAADVQLVINRYSGSDPRLKFALMQNGGGVTSTEYESSLGGDVVGPTIFGHNGAEDAISTAAIRYNASTTPEFFSSRGPVTHYFGSVGSGAAEPLGTPQVLSKPDITATDCGRTSFFVPTGVPKLFRFCGTSAAAPHAAAVAALMLDDEESASPEEIRDALRQSATPIGSSNPCAVGAGLVDAVAAIALLRSGESGAPPSPCGPPVPQPMVKIGGGEITTDELEGTPPASGEPAATTEEIEPRGSTDSSAPSTFFRRKPPRLVRTVRRRARAVFLFRSNEPGVEFLCQFDRKRYRKCGARFVRFFLRGPHVLRVRARDAAGNVDPTPAVYRFRAKRGKPIRGARGSG